MVRHYARTLALAGLVGIAGAALVNGCNDSSVRDQKTICEVDNLSKTHDSTRDGCNACLNGNKQCCDAYGDCQKTEGCESLVQDQYQCIIKAGTQAHAQEQGCLKGGTKQSGDVYDCMKGSCAEACGIGAVTCTPDPAIPVLVGPACDTCTAGKCCTTINACYHSRPCKLAFECVLGCQSELPKLFDTNTAGQGILNAVTAVCQGNDAGASISDFGLPCISKCVHDFVLPVTVDDDAGASPGCASLNLFQCTYGQCANECLGDAKGANDAGTTDAGDASDGG